MFNVTKYLPAISLCRKAAYTFPWTSLAELLTDFHNIWKHFCDNVEVLSFNSRSRSFNNCWPQHQWMATSTRRYIACMIKESGKNATFLLLSISNVHNALRPKFSEKLLLNLALEKILLSYRLLQEFVGLFKILYSHAEFHLVFYWICFELEILRITSALEIVI